MSPPDLPKFLLVDDLEENLVALDALLRRDGLELLRARSGRQALELLLVHDFALALLDVQMPDMDGFELAELMRGTERTRRIPIIFLTAVATDEKRRFRGYEAGAVDYLLKPIEPHILTSKAEVFLKLEQQRRNLSEHRDQLRDALAQLHAHSDNSPLAVLQLGPDLRLNGWTKGAERIFGWEAEEVIGRPMEDIRLVHDDDAAAFAAIWAEMRTGRQQRATHVLRGRRKDGSAIDCEWYCSALAGADGALHSVNAQILDITERRRAEQTQQLLVGELNHRVKNMLATVQAIATQTLRSSRDPADFATNFSGRIQSLSRAHSLLSRGIWRGALLEELIRDQLRLGDTFDESRVTAAGPEIRLPPQLALHLALILHELGTNASKYGALSTAAGSVAVRWRIDDGTLRLGWEERGGPAVKAPSRRGFGTTLIERSIASEGGSARASYRADGIAWEIVLPLPRLEQAEPAGFPSGNVPARPRQPYLAAEAPPVGLTGKRFLIVEDESLVALDLATTMEEAGAKIVAIVGTADRALEEIERNALDGALLDGNLRGEPVDAVAAALTRRGVPFLFVTGYGRESLPAAFRQVPIVGKPFTPPQLLAAATRLVSDKEGGAIALRQPGVTQLRPG